MVVLRGVSHLLIFASGVAMMLAEVGSSAARWGWFRRTSIASLVLWFLILLFGTLLHSTI